MFLIVLNLTSAQTNWKQVSLNDVKTKIGNGTKEQLPTSYNL